MSNSSICTMLEYSTLLSKSQAIEFSYPFDNGIRVISTDDIMRQGETIHYGDEIDLAFWKFLKLPLGSPNDNEVPMTLQDGYLYKYYHSKRVFDVIDNNGIRIIHKTGIKNISQLGIDFTIHKSHQFLIIVEGSLAGYYFIFPTDLNKREFPVDRDDYLNCGVHNIYNADRIRPYTENDEDNPEYNIKYLSIYDKSSYWLPTNDLLEIDSSDNNYKDKTINGIFDLLFGLGDFSGIDWNKNYPTNYFYLRDLFPIEVKSVPEDISKVEPFDPNKHYKPGDYTREDNVLYKVLGDSRPEEDFTTNPFVYRIKDTSRIFKLEVGRHYYNGDIIEYELDGKTYYYLVINEFTLTEEMMHEIEEQGIDYLVREGYVVKIDILLLEISRFKKFSFFAENLYLLYMQLGIGLYPALLPVQRYDETQNNRPIYEPWLIWGFFKFLWDKKTNDYGGDSINIPVFDLSPSFD